MANIFPLKLFTVVTIVIFFLFVACGIYFYTFYNGIFRVSPVQVSQSLIHAASQCTKVSDCPLLPGDILIRRYITGQTWVFNQFAHPYFTHSAFYMGDDKIVEAVGTEKNHRHEIQISALSTSDWMDNGIESFVVIRPQNIAAKVGVIQKNLESIANDPSYRFGLPQLGPKQTTCADLIFKQLLDEQVVTVHNPPRIITPDYLFWLGVSDPTDFEIIGYNVN